MATIPYFALGPTIICGLVGLLKGPDKTEPTPKDDWRKAIVDVTIPAYNASAEIDLCLASLLRQTFPVRKIIIVDDGSLDNTKTYTQSIAKRFNVNNIKVVRREVTLGKTPAIKESSETSDSDVEFILDSDTILSSENYIARTVEELYKGIGIASACGTILPLSNRRRNRLLGDPKVAEKINSHFQEHPDADYYRSTPWYNKLGRFFTNLYHDVLYKFLQNFVYHTEMVFFGSIINPVGCAVAYRRKYIEDVFQKFEHHGTDLTTSEDVFIGFAFTNEGYRNIQLRDVSAATLEPPIYKLPQQFFLWSSAYFQCCYYFKSLLLSPFKVFKKMRHERKFKKEHPEILEKRKIKEAYRQSFGEETTKKHGRPIGWFVFTNLFEKVVFPIVLILFVLFGMWNALVFTFVIETLISSTICAFTCYRSRIKMFFKSILVSPIRYLLLIYDFFVLVWFLGDIFLRKEVRWKK